jgi:hypothetical protein
MELKAIGSENRQSAGLQLANYTMLCLQGCMRGEVGEAVWGNRGWYHEGKTGKTYPALSVASTGTHLDL